MVEVGLAAAVEVGLAAAVGQASDYRPKFCRDGARKPEPRRRTRAIAAAMGAAAPAEKLPSAVLVGSAKRAHRPHRARGRPHHHAPPVERRDPLIHAKITRHVHNIRLGRHRHRDGIKHPGASASSPKQMRYRSLQQARDAYSSAADEDVRRERSREAHGLLAPATEPGSPQIKSTWSPFVEAAEAGTMRSLPTAERRSCCAARSTGSCWRPLSPASATRPAGRRRSPPS